MKVHLIKIQTINRYTNGNVHRKKVFMNWMTLSGVPQEIMGWSKWEI